MAKKMTLQEERMDAYVGGMKPTLSMDNLCMAIMMGQMRLSGTWPRNAKRLDKRERRRIEMRLEGLQQAYKERA